MNEESTDKRGHWITLVIFMATTIFLGGGFYISVREKMNDIVVELHGINSTLIQMQVAEATRAEQLIGVSRDVNDLRSRVNALESRR